MAELRKIEIPEVLNNIPEIREIYKLSEKLMSKYMDDVQAVHDDIFIETSTEYGIARREKILGIVPLDTDNLEDRKLRVQSRLHEMHPYTFNSLKRRLTELCGDEVIVEEDTKNMILHVKVPLSRSNQYDVVKSLLEKIVPMNMYIELSYRFYHYRELREKTWRQLAGSTWEEARNKNIIEGKTFNDYADDTYK
jgi:hypothetical protein